MKHELYTAGGMRKALEGIADDQMLMAQVVSTDGKAWNMQLAVHLSDKGRFPAVIVMEHPDLKTLPELPETNS